jgi:dTDP-4-amino-4,6-dideoxygalactose transaminase
MVKLPYLNQWSAARRHNASLYDREFAGSPVQTPYIRPDCVSIFNQYSIRVDDRDGLRKALANAEIGAEIYYPVPMHLQECFAGKCRVAGSLAESENAANQVLALPIYPELTAEQISCVAQTVKEFVGAAQPV